MEGELLVMLAYLAERGLLIRNAGPSVPCQDRSTAVPTGHRARLPARLHFAQCGAGKSPEIIVRKTAA